jgi:hypothetical protein
MEIKVIIVGHVKLGTFIFGSVGFLCDEVERYYNSMDFNFCL